VKALLIVTAVVVAALTACAGQQAPPGAAPAVSPGPPAPVTGDPDKACDVVPQWALADSLGVVGRGTPEEAAGDTARSDPALPDGPWQVVFARDDEAFLAPPDGPLRLRAVRTEDLGWYVVEGLTCAGTPEDPAARPPLGAE